MEAPCGRMRQVYSSELPTYQVADGIGPVLRLQIMWGLAGALAITEAHCYASLQSRE